MGSSDGHLHDIAHILEINPDGIDQPMLDQWSAHFGIGKFWARAQALVRPT